MAIVKVENKTYTVDPLYQWDKNQVLEIRGLSLAKVPEVHFTNAFMDRAIARQASMNAAGVITTQVPNSLLQKASSITAYICVSEGAAFRTLYKLEIPVKERKRPGDYTFEDDAGEIYSFNALEAQVANALTAATEAKNAYNTATQKETTAAQDLAACKALLEQATAMLASAEERYGNALDTLNGVEDGSVFLKKAGDEMAGPLNMGGNRVTGLADPVNDTDAIPKHFFDRPLLWHSSGNGLSQDAETIDLDLSAYNFIAISGSVWPSLSEDKFYEVVPVGGNTVLSADFTQLSTSHDGVTSVVEWELLRRRVSVTTTGVRFWDSERLHVLLDTATPNLAGVYGGTEIMVPLEIYGIK